MGIPTINADEVSGGSLGIYTAILSTVKTLGNATVAYFLEIVPERGGELWLRFKRYQEEKTETIFSDFVADTVREIENIRKMFFPRECTLDPATRDSLQKEVLRRISAARIFGNDDILGIYFGEGRAYDIAREISCKGCPQRRCQHYIRM